jgi:hypothetical protein
MFYVPTWRPGVQDAENDPQRRSQSPVSLQRTPKGTLRSPSSLRPCWDVILSILREHISFVLQVLG